MRAATGQRLIQGEQEANPGQEHGQPDGDVGKGVDTSTPRSRPPHPRRLRYLTVRTAIGKATMTIRSAARAETAE